MYLQSFIAALALALCIGVWVQAAEITLTDDRGKAITLSAPAQRIVTLAPSIAELAYGAGAGDRLIGVARFSDYPPAALKLPQIGDAARVDLERVFSLNPDLIIGWKTGNQTADIERLERFGFKVFVIEPTTLAAIPRVLRMLGMLAGNDAVSQRAAAEFDRGIAALSERYGGRPLVRVFYEIWHEPLMTVNGQHIISDVIRLCGGNNVFASVSNLTPVVSLESVIAAQPEVVLGGSSAIHPDTFAGLWRKDRDFVKLRHVNAMYVDPDHIQRQTPRILKGAQTVCEHLEKVRSARSARQAD